jgi:methylmalonyl-CoA/ethylmalonyl-CoA epimerase
MRIKRIHHLTLAVRDLEGAHATFERLFGVRAPHIDAIPGFGVRRAELALGDDTLELASALEHDSPVARFVQRRGEGFYNLAVEVDDLDMAIAELAAKGVRVSPPVEGTPGVRSAFLPMSATHGLSIQLVEDRTSVPESPSAGQRLPQVEQPPRDPEPKPPLDLTPDEWSDEQ